MGITNDAALQRLTRPSLTAYLVSSAVEWRFSSSIRRVLWNSTVLTEICKSEAIDLLPFPSAMSCSTSRWRDVRAVTGRLQTGLWNGWSVDLIVSLVSDGV